MFLTSGRICCVYECLSIHQARRPREEAVYTKFYPLPTTSEMEIANQKDLELGESNFSTIS